MKIGEIGVVVVMCHVKSWEAKGVMILMLLMLFQIHVLGISVSLG
jgi:hypothetical protein